MLFCGLFSFYDEGWIKGGATMALMISGWVISCLFSSIPFVLSEPRLDFASALFESVSGLTTTGATTIADLSQWPCGILMWRAVMQWLGGLGILGVFVAILSYAGTGTKSLFANESSFKAGEATAARIHDVAMVMLKVYLVMTLVCFIGLRVLGMGWFDAVTHTFPTVATGGFSPHNSSIGHFAHWDTGHLIEAWIILFMLLCSFNFLIYALLIRRRWKRVKTEEEGRWFMGILISAMAVVLIAMKMEGKPFMEAVRGVSFTVVSIFSTTGFTNDDYEQWPLVGMLILLALMVVGGCSGSTSGGLKVSRLLVSMRCAYQEVVRAFRPNQIIRIQVNGNKLDEQARGQVILFLALLALVALGSTVMVALLETGSQMDMITAIGAVVGTLWNIGPAFGELGPTDNYAWLRPGTKLFLSVLMVLGRLELFALLVLFVPSAWRRY